MTHDRRQASAQEIEVTPEMVDAGLDALIAYRSDENDVLLVKEIFLAMLRGSLGGGWQAQTVYQPNRRDRTQTA
jgi:hypothetical protein